MHHDGGVHAFVARSSPGRWLTRLPGSPEQQLDDAGLVALAARLEPEHPRWVWPATGGVYPLLLAAGVRVRRCHDLALTEALLAGHEGHGPVAGSRADDVQPQLFEDAPADPGLPDQLAAQERRQRAAATAVSPGLPLLVAAESAAGLAAVEMSRAGLPWRADVHDSLLTALLGPRPRLGRPPVLQSLAASVGSRLGEPRLNPDSPAELLRALHRAGVPVRTTRAAELQKHDHPAVEPLLRYKELARLHAAHGWAWRDQWVRDGRFHPEYVPGGVVSGRWASRGGGALQIPRAVRGAVVADPGWKLVVADAGQLEPRVLAALSRDPGMIAATRSGDLYAEVAAQAFGGSGARADAKLALLSSMYGGGSGRAAPGMAALRRRFPAALALLEDAARTGEDGGIVRSVLGRTCPYPAPDWQSGAEAAALAAARARGRFTRNFVIQASAADWANVLVAGLRLLLPAPCELVFFQHDEVIVHAPAAQVPAVIEAVDEAGAEATRLVLGPTGVSVPLDAVPVDSYADKP